MITHALPLPTFAPWSGWWCPLDDGVHGKLVLSDVTDGPLRVGKYEYDGVVRLP